MLLDIRENLLLDDRPHVFHEPDAVFRLVLIFHLTSGIFFLHIGTELAEDILEDRRRVMGGLRILTVQRQRNRGE